MTKRFPMLAALLATLALACGTGSGDGHDTGGHQHGGDEDHDHYTPGMLRTSEQGLYVVAFYSDPGPPAKGLNTFRLGITDQAGTAIEGASITVDLTMPSHGGHGSDRTPVVEEEAPGIYRVEQASLTMIGVWQVDITIEHEVVGLDTVTFRFDAL